MSVAWARSRERQASNPRRPGTSPSRSRSKSSAASVSGSICTCTYFGLRYLQEQAYMASSPGRRRSRVSTELELDLDLDPSMRREFGTLAAEARVRRTAAALAANGFSVLRATDAAEAQEVVVRLIHVGSQVHHGASQSLEASGIIDAIEKSGRFDPVRPRIGALDRQTEADQIRRLSAAPDVMLGSVHAVTETGSLLAASMGGSQLGPYVSGAGR